MAQPFTISQIIQFQEISQYLAANDRSSLNQLQSGSFTGILPQLLYMEGTLLQNLNSLNPGSSTLRGTAEYVLSLCGKYLSQAIQIVNNLAGSRPVITGPANESTTVGGSATFSVSVSGTGPFTYQWLLNGVAIPGATSSTYIITNALLSQNGGLYSVAVTNSVTTVTSNQATLTVSASLVGFWYAGSVDYSTHLLAGTDDVPWNGTFSIINGQPLVAPFPAGQVLYVAVKFPTSQSMKTQYANPVGGIDTGTIPGIAFNTNSFGGNNYIFSRTGNAFGINNLTGQVTYS